MSELQLFIVGAVVAIPAGASMIALILAAIADGRENDRIQARQAKKRGDADA
jgi:hypothetical protein